MVKNGGTCIEAVEDSNGPEAYVDAARLCRQRGRRLCTYTEWLNACRLLSAEVMNMTDNAELVDQFYPSDGGTGPDVLIVGNGSCLANGTSSGGFFRCCL
jgi:hypothetical protein